MYKALLRSRSISITRKNKMEQSTDSIDLPPFQLKSNKAFDYLHVNGFKWSDISFKNYRKKSFIKVSLRLTHEFEKLAPNNPKLLTVNIKLIKQQYLGNNLVVQSEL